MPLVVEVAQQKSLDCATTTVLIDSFGHTPFGGALGARRGARQLLRVTPDALYHGVVKRLESLILPHVAKRSSTSLVQLHHQVPVPAILT